LATGVDPEEMGNLIPTESLLTLPIVQPVPLGEGTLLGEVLHIDHFGNLITSFRDLHLSHRCTVEIAGVRIDHMSQTFSDEQTGAYLAYVGSCGHLEVAIRDGNAAQQLGVSLGTPVHVTSRS
jgi:hypothetical protein